MSPSVPSQTCVQVLHRGGISASPPQDKRACHTPGHPFSTLALAFLHVLQMPAMAHLYKESERPSPDPDFTQSLILNPPAEPLDGKLPFWLGPGGFAAAAGMMIGVEAV